MRTGETVILVVFVGAMCLGGILLGYHASFGEADVLESATNGVYVGTEHGGDNLCFVVDDNNEKTAGTYACAPAGKFLNLNEEEGRFDAYSPEVGDKVEILEANRSGSSFFVILQR